MSDEELRRVLVEAVPDDPAPADRLGQIATRVRRRRLALGAAGSAAVVMAVAMAIALPMTLTSSGSRPGPEPGGPPGKTADEDLGAAGCPKPLVDLPPFADKPGPLVPAGATRAVLCETPTEPSFDPLTGVIAEPLALTGEVEGFVAALNALPDREQFWRLLREREAAKGQTLPPGTKDSLGQTCTLVGYSTAPTFVLTYPDRDPVVVVLDRNCNTVSSQGRSRFAEPNPIDTFMSRYRTQVARDTDPASVRTPECPQRSHPNGGTARDEMSRYRGPGEGLVTGPLRGIAVCRYTTGANGPELTVQKQPSDLAGWAEVLGAQFPAAAATHHPAYTTCADPNAPAPVRYDQVIVVDATGATSDVFVYRSPCPAAVMPGRDGRGSVPTPGLIAKLDALLGG